MPQSVCRIRRNTMHLKKNKDKICSCNIWRVHDAVKPDHKTESFKICQNICSPVLFEFFVLRLHSAVNDRSFDGCCIPHSVIARRFSCLQRTNANQFQRDNSEAYNLHNRNEILNFLSDFHFSFVRPKNAWRKKWKRFHFFIFCCIWNAALSM